MPLSEPFSEYGHGSVTRLREQKSTDVSSVDPAYSLNEMQSKLEIQREVNKELKRLLVASVGDEVQSRFDQLVSERAVLTHELDKSIQQLSEGSEELECMAIQCDVWRSKFIASRLMIDQLLNYKATVLVEHQKCQRVINKLLEEHNQLYQQLSATNSHLKQLTTMATSKKLSERPHVLVRPIQSEYYKLLINFTIIHPLVPVENHSLLELADENSHLSSNLIKSPENISTNNNSVHHSLTVGEQLANQVRMHVCLVSLMMWSTLQLVTTCRGEEYDGTEAANEQCDISQSL